MKGYVKPKPIIFNSRKEFEQAVKKYIEPRQEEIKKQVTKDICNKLHYILAICLYDTYGFGAKRLTRFMEKFDLQMECIAEDYVDVIDYKKECEERNIFMEMKEE